MTDSVASEKESPPTETNGDGFRIVRLEASNIKRLRAITIYPDPSAGVVIVGGNNGEGKSSTLDAIMYALGGKDAVAKDPIRHGQKKAHVRVDLGNYIATRRFSPSGQTLELKTKEGLNVPSPQTFLDGLSGVLNFDPLDFSRMAPAKRLATLIGLVTLDIDLNDLATKRKAIFDSRTDLKRRHRDFEGELRQQPEPDATLPSEKVDVSALVAEKNAREVIKAHNAQCRQGVAYWKSRADAANGKVSDTAQRIGSLREEITRLEGELEAQRETASQSEESYLTAKAEAELLVDPETASIDAQIKATSDINTQRDRAAQYRERTKKLATMDSQIERLSEDIESLDQAKEDALSAATFPIAGLSFEEGDVSYNGILFDQLSSSEQLRVSLAMAMAMNPRLRVIRIMDGSLLDETSMGIVREMAREKAYQVWIEVVGNRQDATVIIEDGAVVGAEEVEPELEVAS